jgi:histidyl-tRNA synthetase
LKKIAISLLIIIISLSPNLIISNAVDFRDARRSIEIAENEIKTAYLQIVEVERARGNISELLSQLDKATNFLEKAENDLNKKNYDNVIKFTNESIKESRAVLKNAKRIKENLELRTKINLRNQVSLSISYSFLIILFGYASWFYFKRHYKRKILKTKPEVL